MSLSADERFTRCLAFVCSKAVEGGFVDDSRDRGGPTNHGVTLATLSHWRGRSCTVDDVRALSLAEAEAIYRAQYWKAVDGDQLPAGVDLMAFDAAVNQGPGTAARFLQHAAGVTPDGVIGPRTIAAVAGTNAADLVEDLADLRLASYRDDAGWPTYGNGWAARVRHAEDQAKAWVGA